MLVFVTSNLGPGSPVIVDGQAITTPFQGFWSPGSRHTLEVAVPVSREPGARYVFSGWSDGVVEKSREARPAEPATYEAKFTKQYELTVTTEVGEALGQGWYDQGSTAYAGLKEGAVITGDKAQKAFVKWDGWATGTDYKKSTPIVMAGPRAVMALWKQQYYLNVLSAPPGIAGLTGQGWQDENASVRVTAPTTYSLNNISYTFKGWSLDGAPPSVSGAISVKIDGPHTISAQYKAPPAVAVRVATNIGSGTKVIVDGEILSAPVNLVWEQNTTHTLYVESLQSPAAGVRYVFAGWSDGGAQRHTVTTPDYFVQYTATLERQYYLTVVSPYGTPGREKRSFDPATGHATDEGWFVEGEEEARATLNTDTVSSDPVSGDPGTRYVFVAWSGAASGTYYHYSNAIKMNSAKTATASWKTQFYLKVVTNPPGLGVIAGESWYDSGSAVTLTAPASITKSGVVYNFQGWSVDGAAVAGNPISVAMSSAHTATAGYAP
ncbi:MAG: hypothetical protein HY687_04715 [Chloroflexi bacterium]|nr:hypothetical protein [Chloroflexota bacterium]